MYIQKAIFRGEKYYWEISIFVEILNKKLLVPKCSCFSSFALQKYINICETNVVNEMFECSKWGKSFCSHFNRVPFKHIIDVSYAPPIIRDWPIFGNPWRNLIIIGGKIELKSCPTSYENVKVPTKNICTMLRIIKCYF